MINSNNEPYIIISDVHLGSEKCNQKAFCCFLEWVRHLHHKPHTVKIKDKEVEIKKPERIILLGDILDLWDPRNGDRNNVIEDSMRPLSILSSIDCEKIYVVGNHDDSLGELEGKFNSQSLCNGTNFHIYDSHYPEIDPKGDAYGINIGNKSYFFLHGHQFDREQAILAYVSSLIGEHWNHLDWFQILYNIPFTKKHWKKNFVIFLGLLLGGEYLLIKMSHLQNPMANTYLINDFLAFIILVWAMIVGFFAFSSIPGIVAHTQRLVYESTNPQDKTVEQVINDDYYKTSKDTIYANVVVFGHTHFADHSELDEDTMEKLLKKKPLKERLLKEKPLKEKLFLNSGCWLGIDEDIKGKMRYANTFIYIDTSGAYIMRWLGHDKIDCIWDSTNDEA